MVNKGFLKFFFHMLHPYPSFPLLLSFQFLLPPHLSPGSTLPLCPVRYPSNINWMRIIKKHCLHLVLLNLSLSLIRPDYSFPSLHSSTSYSLSTSPLPMIHSSSIFLQQSAGLQRLSIEYTIRRYNKTRHNPLKIRPGEATYQNKEGPKSRQRVRDNITPTVQNPSQIPSYLSTPFMLRN